MAQVMASCNICVKSWHQWRSLLSWISSVTRHEELYVS